MAGGVDWVPDAVRGRTRIALGVAVLRLWAGLAVLLACIGLAAVYFQAPQEIAAIEDLVKAHERSLSTSSLALSALRAKEPARSRSGESAGAARTGTAPWERRAVVASSAHQPDAAGRTVIAAEQPEEPMSVYELARALQTELQRVGCYHGEIDGDWGPMSKRAMSGFTDRVNASLPVETPDAILLTMVRGYEGEACGPCRTSETRNDAGRCVPTAVLVRRRGPADGERAGETRAARVHSTVAGQQTADAGRDVEPLPGRMGVGAPVDDMGNVPLTRTAAEDDARPAPAETRRRPDRRERVAERASPPSYYRSGPQRGRKHWTLTIFDHLGRN